MEKDNKILDDSNHCSKTIFEEIYDHQCKRRAVVVRDGRSYCKIHDPEYIKQKGAERNQKLDEEHKQILEYFKRESARGRATADLTLEELEALTPALAKAAPDLREALRNIVKRHEQGLSLNDKLDLEPAREALAKAES